MEIKNKRILVIAPHADDAELGMGGTIHRLLKEGDGNQLTVLILSLPPRVDKDTVEGEMYSGLRELGVVSIMNDMYFDPRDFPRQQILNYLYHIAKEDKFDIVFTPNSKDVHQSHQVVYEETRRAFKHHSIFGYELPWNSFGFDNQMYISLSSMDVTAKKRGIDVYTTQLDREMFKNSLSLELAKIRGQQCGVMFAECFEVIRLIMN